MVHDFLINESIANIHLTSPPLPTRQPMPVSENEMLTHSLAEFVLTLYTTTTQPSPTCKLTHLFLSSTLYLSIVLVFHSNSEHQWSLQQLSITTHPKVLLLLSGWNGDNHFTASVFKQTDTVFLTSQQSYVANNESCNSNVTIKTSIINQGHNNIDKSQPAATRNSESGI